MIYTVTFNPSLDYVVQAEQLVPGEINRTTSEAVYPGGKGVNVSVILSNLGLESTAFGFTAGFTGKALQEMLLEFGAKTDFIPLADGQTRINVKINAGQETEINGQGPKITETAIQELFEKLKSLKAGNVPDDAYYRRRDHRSCEKAAGKRCKKCTGFYGKRRSDPCDRRR